MDVQQRADIFVPIVKVDKTPEGHRIVTGVAASERLDLDGQRADYEWAKSQLSDWFKWGNVREQHGRIAAGKGISIEFDDKRRAVTVVSKAVDQGTIQKLDEGILTGYSWGARSAPGNPIRVKKDADGGERVVGGKIIELSYVDHPCNYDCVIQVAKMVGSDLRKGAVLGELSDNELAKAKLKAKQRNALPRGSFAFPKQRKEPLNDAGHVRAAMARFNQVEGVSDADRAAAKKRILSAAKRFGIDASGFAGKAASPMAGCSCCDDCGPDCQGDCCEECRMMAGKAAEPTNPAMPSAILASLEKLAASEPDEEFHGFLEKVIKGARNWAFADGTTIDMPTYATLADLARASNEPDIGKRRVYYSGDNRTAVEEAMRNLHLALNFEMQGGGATDLDADQRDGQIHGEDAPDQWGGGAPSDGTSDDHNLNWDPELMRNERAGGAAVRHPGTADARAQNETGIHPPAQPAGRAPGNAGRGEPRLPSSSPGQGPGVREGGPPWVASSPSRGGGVGVYGIVDAAEPALTKQVKKLKKANKALKKQRKQEQSEFDRLEQRVTELQKAAVPQQDSGGIDGALLAELVRASHRQQISLRERDTRRIKKALRKQAKRVARREDWIESLQKSVDALGRMPAPGGAMLGRPVDKAIAANDTVTRTISPSDQAILAALEPLTKSSDRQVAQDATTRLRELIKTIG